MTSETRQPARRDPILMYHGVSPRYSRRFREFVTSPESFEEQMSYLAASDFRVCTVSGLVDDRAEHPDGTQRVVALTFDDAFQELSTYAVPILERFGFGATIYVPTAYIGSSSRWLERSSESDRPVLRAEELRELAARSVECGAHSHTHPALDVLDVVNAKSEIERSKSVLEETIGAEVRTFAYPFGYESSMVRTLVARAGYASACRVNYALSPVHEDIYGLSRLPVVGDCSLEKFASLVHGQASLRRQRMRAYAWRPVRRGIGRMQRVRTPDR